MSKLIFDTLLWLEVQNITQELKSVKGPGNTFDLNPKWAITLLFVGNDYSMKNCQRMAKFLPIRGINKSIARAFN
jgi:hypothetical protein